MRVAGLIKMLSRLGTQFMAFFRLIARILTFRDKKYHILTFRDKKYRILTFCDNCNLSTAVHLFYEQLSNKEFRVQ